MSNHPMGYTLPSLILMKLDVLVDLDPIALILKLPSDPWFRKYGTPNLLFYFLGKGAWPSTFESSYLRNNLHKISIVGKVIGQGIQICRYVVSRLEHIRMH